MSWLTFIVWMFWGGILLACVRLITGSASVKRLEREIAQLRAEFNAPRVHERLTELESKATSANNRLESLKGAPERRNWGR